MVRVPTWPAAHLVGEVLARRLLCPV